ncbi:MULTISPECIES: cyclic GMP-AMP synthase DncV-like nucleotidyltransferase [unclassified Bradyrhizobium]|uniref:CBASS cGAMP synthase n=1 Tax=unclassified Bradyrhizobium TaxID=2631580 RepID=UPI001FF92B9A|nr:MULTISPECIES: hypothetical protein [unclassified Bradyrhizobium]MCK1519614.1 hypothetical protein [Bradyrhizobium sp. 17]MCK1686735.1 hypothetical protein [Bradyrhizobium sp. 145]
MGIAASLFYNSDDAENCLDWRVRPSDEQYDTQKERWNDLAEHLKEDLAKRSDCRISSWLQGSYKFSTQVRPASLDEEFDIDLGVYFIWSGQPEDGEHDPTDLKSFVQDSLADYVGDDTNDASGVDEPRAKCSRIHFDGNFHIDVPAYHLDDGRDARSLATSENNWDNSDPKAIYAWWKVITGQVDRARCRRLVRYLKMWSALKIEADGRPSSILITVLVADAFDGLDRDQFTGDDEFLREVVSKIASRLGEDAEVQNPANTKENLNRLNSEKSTALVQKLDELLSIADRALAASTKAASAEIWSEAFDHFFPVPEDDDEEEAVLKEHSRALATIQFNPIVSVQASTGRHTYRDTDRIGPIPKGCDIKFTLANAHQLPAGTTVSWMVRNSGKEAELKNDLGHRVGTGLTVSRDSEYRGTHHMDVAVHLNGLLIGRKRIPVEITGMGFPKRNPAKPAWNKFRR